MNRDDNRTEKKGGTNDTVYPILYWRHTLCSLASRSLSTVYPPEERYLYRNIPAPVTGGNNILYTTVPGILHV